MSAKKKSKGASFASKLGDMMNPTPDAFDDDERMGDRDDDWLDRDDDQFSDEGDGRPVPAAKQPAKLLMRANIALEDGAYTGAVSSRKQARDGEDWEVSGPGRRGRDSESDGEEEGEFDEGESEGEGEGSDEDDEEDDGLGAPDHDHDESEFQSELDRLQKEEAESMQTFSTNHDEEMQKAQHARNQRSIYDNLLEMRIRLQKGLTSANRLPQPATFPAFHKKKPAREALGGVTESARDLLAELVNLQDALIAQSASTYPCAEKITKFEGSRKRKRDDCEEWWERVNYREQQLQEAHAPILEKWSRKVQLTSGTALKGLKTLNQGVLQQVDLVMSDKERLVARSRVNRSLGVAFGNAPPPAPVAGAAPPSDEEIFDDTDFYQTMLRELLEMSSVQSDDPAAMTKQWLSLQKLKDKRRRANVDRKASKGRKIRYDPQPKLVNFMTPQDPPVDAVPVKELFSSLFGHNRIQRKTLE